MFRIMFRCVALLTMAWFASPAAFAQVTDGASVFASSCSSCHQAEGQGLPGTFPPLAGHAADLARVQGGREYLAGVVLFGLQGPIEVRGTTYQGTMPAWAHLSDADVAAVLTHVTRELDEDAEAEDVEPFSSDEVAQVRATERSPQEMHEMRGEILADDATADDPESADAAPAEPPVFTQAQLDRARPLYENRCVECHGGDLGGGVVGGPPLSGGYFDQRWGGRTVAELFEYTRARMPQDRPGSLSDAAYAELVAYILSHNGYRASGAPLPADPDALRRYVIGQ